MPTFLEGAQSYAVGRWCWDDKEFLREQYEDLDPPQPGENPVTWVKRLVEKYGIYDPRDCGFSSILSGRVSLADGPETYVFPMTYTLTTT